MTFSGRKGDNEDVRKAIEAFEKASKIAEEFLQPDNHVRLKIAEYFSEIYGDILNLPDKAVTIAKEAYENAAYTINDDSEISEKYELFEFRRNIARWSSEKNIKHFFLFYTSF